MELNAERVDVLVQRYLSYHNESVIDIARFKKEFIYLGKKAIQDRKQHKDLHSFYEAVAIFPDTLGFSFEPTNISTRNEPASQKLFESQANLDMLQSTALSIPSSLDAVAFGFSRGDVGISRGSDRGMSRGLSVEGKRSASSSSISELPQNTSIRSQAYLGQVDGVQGPADSGQSNKGPQIVNIYQLEDSFPNADISMAKIISQRSKRDNLGNEPKSEATNFTTSAIKDF